MTYILDRQKHWCENAISNSDEALKFIADLTEGKVAVLVPKELESFSFGELYRDSYFFFEKIKMRILECFKYKELKLRDFNSYDRFDVVHASIKGARKLATAIQREGSFIDPACVVMPSFTNLGAYVCAGTMIDTWATVGSCAYVGKNVHIAGGVGIGGVLEPAQAKPVVIEDEVFLGSRCIVVEGCYIGKASVIASGVNLTASTKIFDVTGSSAKELTPGFIPPYSVVVQGSREYKHGFHLPCALIVKTRDAKTDLKVSLNDALRAID